MKSPSKLIAFFLLLNGPRFCAGGSIDIEVDNSSLGGRVGNKMPALVTVDFRQILGASDARINPKSMKLRQLDSNGKPTGDPVPVRFDDPDPKPESFFWDFLGGGGQAGDLVFQHTLDGQPVMHYRLEFERWDNANRTVPASPTPQIGDYDILRYDTAGPMSGIFHTKIDVCDWDADGKLDILAGDGLGRITFYRRTGPGWNDFDVPVPLEVDGRPLKVTYMCPLHAVDWFGHGKLDLVIGDETSGLFVLENIGTGTQPKLAAPKPLLDDAGKPIKSPIAPVPEMTFFKKDYGPPPFVIDYNGDGKQDLLFGGYITGQIFYYENTAKSPHDAPLLHPRGAIKDAKGEAIDVTWCATPCFADLDGDGLPDLISGHIAEEKGKFHWTAEPSLYFWKNTGTRSEPKWTSTDFGFPKHWSDYPPDVTDPRVVDFNGDGKLDILMSGRGEIFYFENVGTKTSPKFEYRGMLTMRNGPLLLCPRMNAIAPVFADLDGDGLPDLISGGSGDVPWSHMVQFGNTPTFERRGYLEADGKKIYHEFAPGDDTTFPFVCDWDDDGLADIIMGDGDGWLTFYKNVGTKTAPAFSNKGKLRLATGEPICVGEPTPATVSDFEGHSGNRSVPAPGDYDGDGKLDLVCANAAGDVFFYRNDGDGKFQPCVKIATGNNRAFTYPVDWNRDGKLDVILNWSGGKHAIYLNRGIDAHGVPKFDVVEIKDRDKDPHQGIPWIPIARPIAIDWDHDGDVDIVWASSYSLLHFASRDFIEHGYAQARMVGAAFQGTAAAQENHP